jgi:hypothetical protein
MILYDLRCRRGHVFEAWFRDSAAYDDQAAAGKVLCPTCGSRKVEKALMAPRVSKGQESEKGQEPTTGQEAKPKVPVARAETEKAAETMRQLAELRQKVEENFDYVGPNFAEEARKIHYGEADAHNIYGETSDEEAESLKDEGVTFGRIPWVPRHDS